MPQLIPSTTPVRAFGNGAVAVAVFPDRQRMITGSHKTLHLWDLETGVMLKKMLGHRSDVLGLAVSRDGQLVASGGENGELIAWYGKTGEPQVTETIKAHSGIKSLDFSPSGKVLATVLMDQTTKLWNTKSWQLQGDPIVCDDRVFCVRYSPSGEYLAIATVRDIKIYNPGTRHCVANLKSDTPYNYSLTWTPDGSSLLSGGEYRDPTIREWEASTWEQVGHPWTGHSHNINAIAIHPSGTLVASACDDQHVRLWRLADQRTIAIFQHSYRVCCVTFSMDGKRILSGDNERTSEWAVPKKALPKDIPKSKAQVSASESKIFSIAARHACIVGDLSMAEEILTQAINADADDYIACANHSLVMARKLDWNNALQDAVESIRIKPSLRGYIAKGVALCGKNQILDATKAFDLAFASTNGDSKMTHFLCLIKAITLFNANRHEEAIERVEELATDFPDTDPIACRVVEAYLRVQLGTISLGNWLQKLEAVEHFTAAANASAFFHKKPIHDIYEEFTVLFGWDLKSLWLTANQQQCVALIRAGRFGDALGAYRSMLDASDEATKASLSAWFSTLMQQ